MLLYKIDQETKHLLNKIKTSVHSNGDGIYLVGGFVRDWLLGKRTRDIDIAIGGDTTKVLTKIAKATNGKSFWLDREKGVARLHAIVKGKIYQIDITAFKGRIETDLTHRDFSINAIAIALSDWPQNTAKLVDPFSGRVDLEKKLIRAINGRVFTEDPSRLLRSIRIATELGFKIDGQTRNQIIKNYDLARRISPERIREELIKILSLPNSSDAFVKMNELKIMKALFPELEAEKGVEQPQEHSWDVYCHSINTLVALESLIQRRKWPYCSRKIIDEFRITGEFKTRLLSPIAKDSTHYNLLKLAAIFHDLGKPATKSVADNGRTRFLGHAQKGSEIAANIMRRLRFSKREIEALSILISSHLRPYQMSNEGLPSPRAVYRFFRDTADYGLDIIMLGLADYLATVGPQFKKSEWLQKCDLMKHIVNEYTKQNILAIPKLISGHDLISIFGLKPGKEISDILKQIAEAQNTGEVSSRHDALALVSQKLNQSGDN